MSRPIEPPPRVVEHGIRMSGGGYEIRNDHPDVERVYPLALWIEHQARWSKVYRRTIIVIDDWEEVNP